MFFWLKNWENDPYVAKNDYANVANQNNNLKKWFSSMPNRKNDCWFNALSQALLKTHLVTFLLEITFTE